MAPTDLEQLERMLAAERPELEPAAAKRIDDRVEAAKARRRLPDFVWPSVRQLSYAGAAATLLVGLVVGVSQVGDDPAPPDPVDGNLATLESAGEAGTAGGAGARADAQALNDFPTENAKKSGVRESASSAEALAAPSPDIARLGGGVTGTSLPAPGGGISPNQDERVVERNASITLSGDPDEVRRMADEVIEITERLGGIVISAGVNERPNQPRQSTANLEIAVPVAKLDQALAEISDVGSVEARSQTDLDVTSEAVSVRNRLNNARDTLTALKTRLGQATDAAEIEQLRVQIARAERRVAARKAEAKQLANRTQFSRVYVGIVANGHGSNGDSDWSLGDAWDDALDVLRTMAGIALVTAAVVIPLALLISLIYVLTARSRRRARESALGDE